MAAQRDFAIVLGAFVALGVMFGALQLMPRTTKGDKLITSGPPATPLALPAAPPKAEPAATEPPVLTIPEPVAAGPSPAETAPVQAIKVAHPIPRPSKRRARRIAKAKAEPCVGPLCVLVR